MPKRFITLLMTIVFVFLFSLVTLPAQTLAQPANAWKYVAQSDEGKYYVKLQIDKLPNRNRAQWSKIISPDGEEEISRTEWGCREKRFHLLQTSSYAANGTALSHQKNLDWAEVTPETVSEILYAEACGAPMKISYAEIIIPQAKMRATTGANGQVLRTAKVGERFPLVPFPPLGAWYHVYDSVSLVEYWLHGNSIKIVSEATGNK